MNEKEIKNRMEISALLDEVSYSLDQKDLKKAMENFTEDARLSLIENGQTVYQLDGKEEILKVLGPKIDSTSIFFHNNGTKMIEILTMEQNAVSATSCIVKMVTETAAIDEDLYYHDKLIRVNEFWYIVERTVEVISKSVH